LVNRTISTDDLHLHPRMDKISVSVNRPDVEMHYSVFNTLEERTFCNSECVSV
jgi:hypothetical protein